MSMFSWLFANPAKAQPDSSGLSRMEATRPVGKRQELESSNGQPANRKSERMARRELLYAVVRESMTRAGVLAASYKFKVLSLDARGRQFLVMVDLARDHGSETARLAEIEASIAQAAKSRHDIVVTAVYWRSNEHVAIGDPGVRAQQRSSTDSHPMPLELHPASGPAPLDAHPDPLPSAARRKTSSPHEQIQADEVQAFKRALAAGVSNPAAAAAAAVGVAHGASARAADGSARHGPQSYTLLTGFEDTEMAEPEQRRPTLSGTQYGDLN
jgi:hypothetical protein